MGDISGWKNSGVAFSLGMLTPSFALAGFDGALHLSEEVTNPKTTVPHAIVWGLAFNGLLAFGVLLAILYTMGDYAAALSTPTGWPIIEIYLQATKSKAGMTGLMTIGLIAAFVAVFGALASVSRLIWAFSRDGGMPFSSFFVHVCPLNHVYSTAFPSSALSSTTLYFIAPASTSRFLYSILTSLWLTQSTGPPDPPDTTALLLPCRHRYHSSQPDTNRLHDCF